MKTPLPFVQSVRLACIHAWRPKVTETIVDIREGRLSFSKHLPIVVSRLDTPRGGLFIVDGHHRVIEAALRGDRKIFATLDAYVPRIERTGGAHRSWLADMVKIVDAVQS